MANHDKSVQLIVKPRVSGLSNRQADISDSKMDESEVAPCTTDDIKRKVIEIEEDMTKDNSKSIDQVDAKKYLGDNNSGLGQSG